MDAHQLLRTQALTDLRRLIPRAHYMLRSHSPQADRELVELLLQHPEHFELMPREHCAADALGALATYQLRSRAIWTKAYPARDIGAPDDSPGVTDDEQVEIDALREVLRRSALVYARIGGAALLVEAFQPREDAAAASDAAAMRLRRRQVKKSTVLDDAIIAALHERGIDPMKMPDAPLGNKPWPLREQIAEALGVSSTPMKKAFTRLRGEGRMSPYRAPRTQTARGTG